jgi:phage/plasmid-like protein (TIGR03299 family)
MAHELDMSNGRANMAYVKGAVKPWHGLGFEVAPDATVDEWAVAGGLKFKVVKGELLFKAGDDVIHTAGAALNKAVLYRDDTMAPLSVMSLNRYTIHQPSEILDFIADVSKAMDWPVETVGSLFGGRKIWALLRIPEEFTLPGGDVVKGYMLVTTSFDGSSGTEFRYVTVRVVCNNTLEMAVGSSKRGAVVYHTTSINIAEVKAQLGIGLSVWAEFIEKAKQLAAITISKAQAQSVLRKVYGQPKVEIDVTPAGARVERQIENPNVVRTLGYFEGQGIGSQLESARGTGWGLVNAVTQEVDHFGSNRSARLNSAWFGPGAARKAAVVDAVLAL